MPKINSARIGWGGGGGGRGILHSVAPLIPYIYMYTFMTSSTIVTSYWVKIKVYIFMYPGDGLRTTRF